MADIQVPSIAAVTPAAADTVLGVQGGAVKRMSVAGINALATAFVQAGTGAVARTMQDKARESWTSVADFGAVGDGTTDDTAAVRLAITAAGVGGTVFFVPGKTYLLSGLLAPLSGQTFIGYGAALKRCAEIKSATATNIPTSGGSTDVTVADGSLFSVGMHVTVYDGASCDANAHVINSIDGNVLNLGTTFTTAFPSGGTVITAVTPIYCSASDVKIIGLECDGNRANNTSLAKWELHAEIRFNSDRGVVENCYIHDAVSEGIEPFGDGVSVRNCTIINCGGNGIHFSGCEGGEASGNYVYNCNILGTAPGHADGGIIFSDLTGHSIIVNNYIDTAISGVASIDTDANSSVVITGNIIRNCTSTAIEGVFPASNKGGKCVIANNLIYDSVKVNLAYAQAFDADYGPYNWIVANNYLEDTSLEIFRGVGFVVQGNIITSPANTTSNRVYIQDCQQAAVIGNTITGGVNGVYVVGDSCAAVKISNNTFLNNYARAVYAAAVGRAISVEGNTISAESGYTAKSDYKGIDAANGVHVLNNVLDIQVTSTGFGILCGSGGEGVNGPIVHGNVIRSSALAASIKTYGGSQNVFATNNFIQQAVSNGGGVSNTFADNYTIN